MRLTNHQNLPQALVEAVSNDEYSKGQADISVTGLLKPPRMAALEATHAEALSEDVSDRIWSLMGKLGHKVLEQSGSSQYVEHRLFAKRLGWTVSGQMDVYEQSVIEDWKFVSTYACVHNLPKFEEQLNLYRLLAHENGLAVDKLRIRAIYRDWSKNEASRNREYPQFQVQTFDLMVWPLEEAYRFLEDRITAHQKARTELPLCGPVDRWAKAPVWAVTKIGAKRAKSLHDTEDQAKAAMTSGYELQYRPGMNIRCHSYCNVGRAGLCEQWEQIKKEAA